MRGGTPLRSVKHPPINPGDRFGKLTVLELAEPDKRGQTHWLCRCECGNTKRIMANNLKRGLAKGCGCERNRRIAALNKTHGLSHTPEYINWDNMMGRCYRERPGSEQYKAKGIYVCRRWHDFELFLADMGSRPTLGHSIERIDNDGSYTCGKCDECKEHGAPLNCRWATFTEQMRNTSRSHFVTYEGKRMTVSELAEQLGVSYNEAYNLISKGC